MIRDAVIGHQEERLFRDSTRQIDEPVDAFYRARTDQRQASARAIGRVVGATHRRVEHHCRSRAEGRPCQLVLRVGVEDD